MARSQRGPEPCPGRLAFLNRLCVRGPFVVRLRVRGRDLLGQIGSTFLWRRLANDRRPRSETVMGSAAFVRTVMSLARHRLRCERRGSGGLLRPVWNSPSPAKVGSIPTPSHQRDLQRGHELNPSGKEWEAFPVPNTFQQDAHNLANG